MFKQNNQRKNKGTTFPPQIPASFALTKTIRFSCASAVNSGVQALDFAQMIYMITGTTTANSLLNAIKLNYVEIWSPATIPSTISIEFDQNNAGMSGSPSKVYTDTCVSTAIPAHLRVKPPKNSLSGFWIAGPTTSTNNIFTLVAPQNSIVDINVTFTLNDTSASGAARTIGSGTAGNLGIATLVSGLIPVSFPTYG